MFRIALFLAMSQIFMILPSHASDNNSHIIIPEGKPFSMSDKAKKEKKKKIKRQHAGWVEKICIGDVDFSFKAKLDTGAHTSSVNAEIIREFQKNGKQYVLYRVLNNKKSSETFQSEVTRYTRIKLKTGDKGIKRPYVMMRFKIGKHVIEEEVNLAERDHFNYPVLIGRNMMANYFLVDPSRKDILKTKCH